MIFAYEKPRNQLLQHGIVYTFRVNGHKTGNDWVNDGRGKPKLADVKVEFVLRVIQLREDLLSYVKQSGFDSVEEWVDLIKKKYPNIESADISYKGYLYRVTIRK